MAVRDNLSKSKQLPMVFKSIIAGLPAGNDGIQVNFSMNIPCEEYTKLTIGSISGGGFYGSKISYTIRGEKPDGTYEYLEYYQSANRTVATVYDITNYVSVEWHDCRYYGGSYASGLTFNNVVFEQRLRKTLGHIGFYSGSVIGQNKIKGRKIKCKNYTMDQM